VADRISLRPHEQIRCAPDDSRIAARRVFQSPDGKSVVLTIGVFGIDGLQALHLAMKCAAAVLESTGPQLVWLGEQGDLGMPKFLPELPKPHQDRLEAIVDRETTKFWRRVERAQKANTSKLLKRKRTKAR
jgi:hypothetical protein